MQGIMLLGFRRYVRESFGDPLWRTVQESAGTVDRIYLPVQSYPSIELLELVGATARLTDMSSHKLLEGFGEFLAPDLMRTYSMLLDPRWKFLDILTNTESILERVAALKQEVYNPSDIRSTRISPRGVLIAFSPQERLCAMLKGVVRGLAAHLKESVHITETSCMVFRGRQCEVYVTCEGKGTYVGPRKPAATPHAGLRRTPGVSDRPRRPRQSDASGLR